MPRTKKPWAQELTVASQVNRSDTNTGDKEERYGYTCGAELAVWLCGCVVIRWRTRGKVIRVVQKSVQSDGVQKRDKSSRDVQSDGGREGAGSQKP